MHGPSLKGRQGTVASGLKKLDGLRHDALEVPMGHNLEAGAEARWRGSIGKQKTRFRVYGAGSLEATKLA